MIRLARSFRLPAVLILVFASFLPGRASDEPMQYPEVSLANDFSAYLWVAGATVLPVAAGLELEREGGWENVGTSLLLAGALLGPSAGQFYAGSVGPALVATAARTVGASLFLLSLLSQYFDAHCADCGGNGESGAEERMEIGGAFLFGAGTLYSFIDTHFAVRRNNEAVTGRRAGWSPALEVTREGRIALAARGWLRF